AGALDLAALAGEAVHVGGRPAEIRYDTGESRHGVAHRLDLAHHGILRAALDDATLVLGDRAERAATEAAALDRDREADHLVGRDIGLAVERMWQARIRALVYPVHLLGGERNRRRIQPHLRIPVTLHQRPGVTWVRLQVQDAGGVSVQHRIRG